MIGIQRIGVYIPENREDNYKKALRFGIGRTFIDEKIGVRYTTKKLAREKTSNLCMKAYSDLKNKIALNNNEIGCAVVVTQNPDDRGLPHTSAILQDKLNLPQNCAMFDISLGCSGYVYALSALSAFMKENGWEKGLLFTADPYSTIIDSQDKNTSLLFGDAATVTLLSADAVWDLGKFDFGTYGKGANALCIREGKLFMDGRAVFNFTATIVVESIRNTLQKNGLGIGDIDKFVLHQASKYLVDTIALRLKAPEGKIEFVAQNYGNTVSSSIPIVLDSLFFDLAYSKLLLSGFGVGLSWGSTIIKRRQ